MFGFGWGVPGEEMSSERWRGQACGGPPEHKMRELQARETQAHHLSQLDSCEYN